MKKFKFLFIAVLIFGCFIFSSCTKGYQVRFTNYDTEKMDTVIVGKDIIFTAIDLEATTGYKDIKSGNQAIKCITKTKKVYLSTISIPNSGTGKRTVQIDGLNAISILEN